MLEYLLIYSSLSHLLVNWLPPLLLSALKHRPRNLQGVAFLFACSIITHRLWHHPHLIHHMDRPQGLQTSTTPLTPLSHRLYQPKWPLNTLHPCQQTYPIVLPTPHLLIPIHPHIHTHYHRILAPLWTLPIHLHPIPTLHILQTHIYTLPLPLMLVIGPTIHPTLNHSVLALFITFLYSFLAYIHTWMLSDMILWYWKLLYWRRAGWKATSVENLLVIVVIDCGKKSHILDLGLYIVDGIRGFDLESDGFAH